MTRTSMTRTLILTRHAKSSWDDPQQPDFARPLNKRGRAAAPVIGQWLIDNAYLPQEVICSSAARTRETWDRMGLETDDLRLEDALYHAPPSSMLTVLRAAHAPCVLMLGHNPGIAEFASMLAKAPAAHPRFHDYPTCATTVLTFDIESWQDVTANCGTVRDFVIPRELMA